MMTIMEYVGVRGGSFSEPRTRAVSSLVRARAPVHAVRGGGSGTAVLTNQMCAPRVLRPKASRSGKARKVRKWWNFIKFGEI